MASSMHAQRLSQHGDAAKRSSATSVVSPARKPAVPAHTKASPAKQLLQAFQKLCQLLRQEWASITSLNLGVKSGTAVMEHLQLARIRHLARRVHMLAVSDAEAGAMLVQLAGHLGAQEFQQLQVMLDVQGLEELSDYLSLLCRNAGGSSGKGHSCCARAASATADGTTKQQQPRTSGITEAAAGEGEPWPGAGGSIGSSSRQQRRQRAAAGLCDLAALSSSRPALFGGGGSTDWRDADDDGGGDVYGARCRSVAAAAGAGPLASSRGLRFASLLPPGHILVKTAEGLQQQQQFEAALQAGAVARQPLPPAMPLLTLPQQQLMPHGEVVDRVRLAAFQDCMGPPPHTSGSSPASGSARSGGGGGAEQLQQQQHQWQPWRSPAGNGCSQPEQVPSQETRLFRAPAMDLERLWKAGREATTQAVLTAAHLQVHELPVGAAALLLTPGLVVVTLSAAAGHKQQLGQQQAGDGGGSSSRQRPSRRDSSGSRPLTARSRPSTAGVGVGMGVVPPLPLGSVILGGEGDSSSRPGSARPGSAAGTSRFSPQHAAGAAADSH